MVSSANNSFLALRSATSRSRQMPGPASTGRVTGMEKRYPLARRISSRTRSWSVLPINRSRGENAPLANNSKSHTERSDIWIELNRVA